MRITFRLSRPHRHQYEFVAHKAPRPEGGTFFQLTCINSGCGKLNGPRRFKPQQIVAPSVLFTAKVRADLMPALMRVADEAQMAPVDYINRIVREHLRAVESGAAPHKGTHPQWETTH